MRVMVLMKAAETEQTGEPPAEIVDAMLKYNEELVKAGVLLAGEGLHASERGAMVTFEAGQTTIVDGPFTEAKELIAGFWMFQVGSMDEALEWVKRHPAAAGGPGAAKVVLELREVFDPDQFVGNLPDDLVEKEKRLRRQLGE
ncbi:MAG: YciI family protein [Hamadaea sp.]|nr:YciI family protein [Hamadaea sp.]